MVANDVEKTITWETIPLGGRLLGVLLDAETATRLKLLTGDEARAVMLRLGALESAVKEAP